MKNFKKLSLLGALALSALPTISSDISKAALFAGITTATTVALQARKADPKNDASPSQKIFTEGVNPIIAGGITAGAVGTYAAAKSSNPKVQAAAIILGVPATTYFAFSWLKQYSHANQCFSNARRLKEEYDAALLYEAARLADKARMEKID